MTASTGFGRDRRRRLGSQDAATLFSQADGRCQKCSQPLGVNWHQAHLVAWSNGGATSLDQMEAWCAPCNLKQGAVDAADQLALQPRAWQAAAMDVVLERLWQTGSATVHAAPGAGKTFFAGLTFQRLAAAGLVDRILVVVPNRALQRQWAEALGRMRIHLDWEPRDGFLELPTTVGAVVSYQGLPNAVAGHIQRMTGAPTLVVLDEVHHVGEHRAWGDAVRAVVGSTAEKAVVHPAGVLNMTGTLFRSSGSQRISTVRYDQIDVDGVPKLQAVADFSVPASKLIGIELRRPDLYAYDGRVELVDIRRETVVSGDIADLTAGPQVNAAVRASFLRRPLVNAFAVEALRLLSQQLATMQNHEPLKLLWVADNQTAARMAAEEINKAANRNFARLIISDNPTALKDLRDAAADRESCAIVAVRMVTEGFDCPQVSVIAYASATTAVLTLAQTMARAMRVTAVERNDRMMLPAQILIPNNPSLRAAFTEALIGHFHLLDVPEEGAEAIESGPGAGGGDGPRLPRYQLTDASTLDLHSATVLGEPHGTVMADDLQAAIAVCLELSIPEVYAPRVALASRKIDNKLPLYVDNTQARVPVEEPADPRTVNKARRQRMTGLSNWMNHHVEHDKRFDTIGVFQGQANAAAGLDTIGGRKNATADQLQVVELWMLERIREHCNAEGCALPTTAREVPGE